MNTPPPEGSAAANGHGLPHGNGSGSSSYLGLHHHDDDIRLHSPALRQSPPLDERKHECPEGDEPPLALMLRTVDFAAYKHRCQRRKDLDQTPYINHPVAVANLLSSTGVTDIRVLQAAVLHDTVEDTHTTIEEVIRAFGPEVASIVEECTDDTTLTGQERKAEQLRTAPLKSREAQQVKLADKLHNLESISRSPPVGWTVRRIQAYFIWAKHVTDICGPSHPPLAARLQTLYETAHTRVNGEYFPCHPDVCGPLTDQEKKRVDPRFALCQAGDNPCPSPIFF
ncbi:Guanosine-3',5'-bis(diphosphate) 3'-pyrophosphohydrolase MESH1 [Vanrija pseudolonga]|uniref:Guanosine-3',5'-bis(diphosphate) 3'-pyrophosphohydrolase MESH1 n=1 Tax=Vanrija pseudolonga TaxID=143232 RepID=A0AAF1BEN3_9TREE|nr:Guanosine-3',5'-bis(diphosphate) 3'-pyrophosphohydrolase MESH1 [Vanrija pseudolonga]